MALTVSRLWEERSGSQLKARRPLQRMIPFPPGSIGSWAPARTECTCSYVTPDEKQIYTTNVSSATVSILEKVTLPPMGPPPGMRPPHCIDS